MTLNLARDQPHGPHLRPTFVPIVLARMGGESGDRIGAFGGGLIPAVAAPSVADPPRTTIRFGQASWLSDLLASHLPEVEVVSRIQPLEPFVVSPNSLILPVWAIGRSTALPPEPLETVLRRVAGVVRDPEFPSKALAAIRRALVSDPLTTRLMGEEPRMRAASEAILLGAAESFEPPLVGLLPDRFTLTQLQAVAAGILGRPADDLESGSNFRRRTQELVHRRVLVEDDSPASAHDRERGGRPPRRYRFDGGAWREWIFERSGGPVREREAALHRRALEQLAERFAASAETFERETGRTDLPRDLDLRMSSGGSWRSRADFQGWAAPSADLHESLESTRQRMERMERMIEALYRQSRETRSKP